MKKTQAGDERGRSSRFVQGAGERATRPSYESESFKGKGQLESLKSERKAVPKHVELRDLPPEQRVAQLGGGRKRCIDTIKIIAHRAEAALVRLARESLRRHDDARSLGAATP